MSPRHWARKDPCGINLPNNTAVQTHTTSGADIPGSLHWSPSFSTQPLCASADLCLSLGSAMRCLWPSMLVSLCSACHSWLLHFPLSLETPYLSRLISHLLKGVPRVRELFLFHSFLPGEQVPSQFLFFFFFPFILPSYVVIFLAILVTWGLLPAFCRYSVRIIPRVNIFMMYF